MKLQGKYFKKNQFPRFQTKTANCDVMHSRLKSTKIVLFLPAISLYFLSLFSFTMRRKSHLALCIVQTSKKISLPDPQLCVGKLSYNASMTSRIWIIDCLIDHPSKILFIKWRSQRQVFRNLRDEYSMWSEFHGKAMTTICFVFSCRS